MVEGKSSLLYFSEEGGAGKSWFSRSEWRFFSVAMALQSWQGFSPEKVSWSAVARFFSAVFSISMFAHA